MRKVESKGFAVFSKNGPLKDYKFEQCTLEYNDILIKTIYSGICHSDISCSLPVATYACSDKHIMARN